MTQLFLGNGTKQNVDFYYRMAEDDPRAPPRRLSIRYGTQIKLPGHRGETEHSREALDAVLKPNLKYGWVQSSEISRVRHVAALIYSFDKPITEAALTYIIDSNDGRLDDMALEEQIRTAASMSNMAPSYRGDAGRPRAFDAEVHEVAQNGRDEPKPLHISEVRQDAPRTRKRGKAA